MSSLIVEVVKIKEISPIDGADRIVLATVKGWNVIIQKDSYQIGDLVVFIPPDSVIPAELIEKHGLTYLKNGDRIRSVKLKGVISQGLILGLECLEGNGKKILREVSGRIFLIDE